MPTPSPIIAATVVVKSAVGSTAEISGMTLSDNPMPINALTIGSPMATTDPKAINKMTTAATRPMPSVAGTAPLTNGSPPSAICSSAVWCAAAIRSIAAAVSSIVGGPVLENDTAANEIPPGPTCSGWSRGPSTWSMRGNALISSTTAAVEARSSVLNTTVVLTPVTDGMCAAARS